MRVFTVHQNNKSCMLTQCFKLVFFHLGRTIAKKCITAYFLFHLGKKQYSKSAGKMKKTDFFPQKSGFRQSWAKSLGQYCNIHIFLSFLGSLINSASFSKFSCSSPSPPPYTKLKLRKNSGYTRPTLFVG